MSIPVRSQHRKNAAAIRAFYRRPAVRKVVRLYQKTFDGGYWSREEALARKAERLDQELSLACRRIFHEAGIRGTLLQYPRVFPVFDSRARLALSQLLGITHDDHRMAGALIWFKWLVRNWNLEKDDVPKLPKEILGMEPQLSSYAIYVMPLPRLTSEEEAGKPWHLNSWVMAQVFPGVSHRDLQECMGQVYTLVNAQSSGKGVRPSKGGAPAKLADWEWEDAFSQFGPVVNRISSRLHKIQGYIENRYGEHYSVSQIRARYEKFLSSRPEYRRIR